MTDPEGNKYYTNEEKCDFMERTWRNIFRITEDEEAKDDAHHSDDTDVSIHVNHQRVSSYPITDLSRLSNENFHTREIDQ